MRAHIAEAFGDLVVGEEGPATAEADVRGRRRWYVDPLDGTTNFTKGWRRWGVSIAYCTPDDRMAAAVVHVPLTGETFTAVRGEGAQRDGVAVRVADAEPADTLAILNSHADLADAVPAIARATLSLRITGSTVCDLVDVACGRAGLYLGTGQGRWDLAAGVLIAAEAGATVTDLDGAPLTGPADEVFAAAPRVHAALLPAIRAAH